MLLQCVPRSMMSVIGLRVVDILSILERMKSALNHCHRSLLRQLSRRLQKFPRFYFLSLEDVLHIVCNGKCSLMMRYMVWCHPMSNH